MKLLYITEDRYPPFRADVVELFARKLRLKGHTIDWLMQRGPAAVDIPSPIQWMDNTVYLTPRSGKGGLAGRVLNNLLGMLGDFAILPLALRGRYDVIQVRDKFFAGLIAWLAARLTGAKFVHWMSYPFPESKMHEARLGLVRYRPLVWLKGAINYVLLYGIVLRLADHVFVQSRRMLEDVAAKGIAAGKMTPVPMGIRSDQVGHASDARAPEPGAPLLLYLGIIQKVRHSEMLVRVLSLVRSRHPGAKLIYVGEGQHPDDRQAVVNMAKKLGLEESVVITGFLPMERAWEYVRQADICFSPYYPTPILLSASPTKLVEYLAMAKCVVANEHPEQRLVLEESGAGRCVPWDEKAFADEVCRLLDDPEAARLAASRGPDWVRAHRTYDVIAEQVDAAYARLLNADQ